MERFGEKRAASALNNLNLTHARDMKRRGDNGKKFLAMESARGSVDSMRCVVTAPMTFGRTWTLELSGDAPGRGYPKKASCPADIKRGQIFLLTGARAGQDWIWIASWSGAESAMTTKARSTG